MKKHPRIRELQLGKSVKEFVGEILKNGDYDFIKIEDEQIEAAVKKIVEINDPNVRFGVFLSSELVCIRFVNNDSDFEVGHNYYDSDWGSYYSDDAWDDCDLLNKLVEELLGPHKSPKKKILKKTLLRAKGLLCPHCGCKDHHILDNFRTDDMIQELGCKSCGLKWRIYYQRKLVDVQKFG
jgi:hypothetical protein